MDYATDAYKFGALLCGLHGAGRLAGLSDIAAHVVPQAVAFLILAVLGVNAWRSMYEDVGTTPGVYAPAHEDGIRCCILQTPFQLYELACAARVKRLRGKTFEMVAHHFLALLLACLAVNKDIYYFYGTYFFGVSELSSLPLVFLDLFKMFPEVRSRRPVVFSLHSNNSWPSHDGVGGFFFEEEAIRDASFPRRPKHCTSRNVPRATRCALELRCARRML